MCVCVCVCVCARAEPVCAVVQLDGLVGDDIVVDDAVLSVVSGTDQRRLASLIGPHRERKCAENYNK